MHGWFGSARRCARSTAIFVLSAWVSSPTHAQELGTHLLDIRQGSHLSQIASSLRNGGYELSGGSWVSFDDWYRTDWLDLHIDMLTQLGQDSGILWGISTGERGEKYVIEPSLKLGFVSQVHPRPNSTLALTMATTVGGRLIEQPCEADYGEIGGIQTVNCRLAAGILEPAETLQYLVNADPTRFSVSLSYRATF